MNLFIDTALKGSLLIAAAAAAAYFLRNRSAAARHAAWTAAVIGHLVLPALSILMPEWRVSLIPSPSWMESSVPAAVVSINEVQPPPTSAPIPPASVQKTSPSPTQSPTQTPTIAAPPSRWDSLVAKARATNISPIVLLWIIGSMIVLLRLAVGTWKVGRLAKQGDRVDDGEWLSLTQRLANRLGITRPLTLLRGDKLAVPVTWGVVYPAVLLPPDSAEWPEARRRFVLVHEMAHVKRFDALTQLLTQFAIALFWFDPLIWLAAHRMRVEREHACDDYVIRDGTRPSLYAGELLEMVQSIGTPHRESAAPAFAALAMARRSEFEGRMLAILDSRQERHTLGRASAVAATVSLFLLALPLAALRPFAAQPAKAASTDAPTSTATPAKASNDRKPNLMYANACDTSMRVRNGSVQNMVHTDSGDEDGIPVLEYITTSDERCAQGAFVGHVQFADDRVLSLGNESFVTITEVLPSNSRTVRVTRRSNGTLEFASRHNGATVPFDDSMRAWLSRLLPEILAESGVDVPERVARDLARGGVPAVLQRIATLKSAESKRQHYEALLKGRSFRSSDYEMIAKHVTRSLSSSPTDLSKVLSRMAGGPARGTKSLGEAVETLGRAQDALGNALGAALGKGKSSGDTANTLAQYGVTDDPEMLLLSLHGAVDVTSDTDKRVLLQTLAAGALRRRESKFRDAWFDAAATITSDTDLRVVLQTALPYGHNDLAVTSRVLKLVASNLSSDMEKRVVLMTAAAQKTITTSKLRQEFMEAAKTISSSTELAIVMAAASKQ